MEIYDLCDGIKELESAIKYSPKAKQYFGEGNGEEEEEEELEEEEEDYSLKSSDSDIDFAEEDQMYFDGQNDDQIILL